MSNQPREKSLRPLDSPDRTIQNKNLSASKERKQYYHKFVMTVYHTIGKREMKIKRPQKDHINETQKDKSRITYFQFPDMFPKLTKATNGLNYFEIDNDIDKAVLYSSRAFPNSKYKILKNYLNNGDDLKKKQQLDDNGALGLQIKRVDYSQKRKMLQKKFPQEQAQKTLTNTKEVELDIQYDTKDQQEQLTQKIQDEDFQPKRIFNKRRFKKYHGQDVKSLGIYRTHEQDNNNNKLARIQMHDRSQRIAKLDYAGHTSLSKDTEMKKPYSSYNHSHEKYAYYHDKVKKFKFNVNQNTNKIYEKKINSYREFIFKIHFAHNVFMDLTKNDQEPTFSLKTENKYKVWIGMGNNSLLIKSLMKRRFWWIILDQKNNLDCNFIWTQLKINDIYKKQKPSKIQVKQYLQQSQPQQDSDEEEVTKKKILPIASKKKKQVKQDYLYKILIQQDIKLFREYTQKFEKKNPQKPLHKKNNIKKELIELPENNKAIIHNHLQNNFFLGNKKAMFYNLKQYYQLIQQNVFQYLPLTFHIKNGVKDPQYKRFLHYYKKRAAYMKKQQKAKQQGELKAGTKMMRNIWIVKPGELSNRGNGITVIDQVYEINKILNKKEMHTNGTLKTYIVQLYIDRPLLYNRRKFDIRHYMLITNLFGIVRGYWYSQGYIRTASYEFDIFNFQREIHLTNDAVQKYTQNYGRYQPGNKLSYSQFQRYLDNTYPKKNYSFYEQILPQMKQFGRDAVRSAYLKLSPNNLENNFQIFGLDFMIDENFRPWLIEINTNPCLELSCPLLQRLIPAMVQQSFRLSIDIVYPPPCHYSNTNKHLTPDISLQYLKYELIFDSQIDGQQMKQLYKNIRMNRLMVQIGQISQQEQFQDNGFEIKIEEDL